MFWTAAMLFVIGAILSIILVGLLLLFVAEILLVVAFFSISDTQPQPAGGQAQPSWTPPSPPTAS